MDNLISLSTFFTPLMTKNQKRHCGPDLSTVQSMGIKSFFRQRFNSKIKMFIFVWLTTPQKYALSLILKSYQTLSTAKNATYTEISWIHALLAPLARLSVVITKRSIILHFNRKKKRNLLFHGYLKYVGRLLWKKRQFNGVLLLVRPKKSTSNNFKLILVRVPDTSWQT